MVDIYKTNSLFEAVVAAFCLSYRQVYPFLGEFGQKKIDSLFVCTVHWPLRAAAAARQQPLDYIDQCAAPTYVIDAHYIYAGDTDAE